MDKKAILVILCLMAHHECVPQNFSRVHVTESSAQIISDKIVGECDINISSDTLNICSRPLRLLTKEAYFSYEEAMCIALYDSVHHLCNVKNTGKLTLEEVNPIVQNATEFCSKMRSALNDSVSNADVSERKDWIIKLKDRLIEDRNCENACIQTGVLSPVCSTFLQINAYLISDHSVKQSTSGTSDAETMTTKKQDSQVDSTIPNNQKEDTGKETEDIPETTFADIKENPDFNEQETEQEQEDERSLIKSTVSKPENNVETTKESGKKVGTLINHKLHKHPKSSSTTAIKGNINKQTLKQDTINSQQTNISTSNPVKVDKLPVISKQSSDDGNNGINNESAVSNQQFTDTGTHNDKINKKPLLETLNEDKENNKDAEQNKESSVGIETGEKVDKPSPEPQSEDNTNVDKPPIDDKENDKGPEMESVVEVPKNKNVDIKSENSPHVSKTQNFEKQKVDLDGYRKKLPVSKAEQDVEPAQAHSPEAESDLPNKDQPMYGGNDEAGNNQDTIDLIHTSDFGLDDDDDDVDMTPKKGEEIYDNPSRGTNSNEKFEDAKDSHFFAYFMTTMIICIVGYLVYHNKQKILALALEGRSRKSTRRRPNTSGYRKLDSNLEEAVTSACSTSVTHVIY